MNIVMNEMRKELPRSGIYFNGIFEPEARLAKLLQEDKKALRKNAKAVFRCPVKSCLLGFAYPVRVLKSNEPVPELGEIADDGQLLVKLPTNAQTFPVRAEPFSPYLYNRHTKWWFFAYRHIEPEVEFYADPAIPVETVGWIPVTKMREARDIVAEQQVQLGELKDVPIMGRRDVWVVSDESEFCLHSKRTQHFNLIHPPGYVSCPHIEYVFDYDELLEKIGQYKGKKAIVLRR